ncbi:MAG: hypothetical protein QME64_08235 [bacterium]|nr:hypothetical protein [bacterium]
MVPLIMAEEVPVTPDALSFLQVNIKPTDPGISWLYNNWVRTPRQSSLREIAAKQSPTSAIIGLYPAERSADKILYAASLTYLRPVETDSGFTAFVGKMLQHEIGPEYPFIKYPQAGSTIYFGTNTARKTTSGYAFLPKQVVIGNTFTTIQKTIESMQKKQASITTQPDFIQLTNKMIPAKAGINPDILIYGNNSEQQFAQFLAVREKKWKMSLLLSAKDIRALLIGLDALDPDKLQGTMIFKAANPKAIPDIADDAGFIGEAIRRKFMAEKIKWNSKVTTSGDYVILQFDVAGLKPLWLELFKSGGLAVVK